MDSDNIAQKEGDAMIKQQAGRYLDNDQQEDSYDNNAKSEQQEDSGGLPVKKKRQRPDSTANAEQGENRKFLNHSLKIAELPPISPQSADEVKDRIFQYFQICADDDMKPSIAGLSLSLGMDRRRVWEAREGVRGSYPDAVRDLLKKAQQIIELQMVDYMQNGRINPVAGIFMLKNHFGYKDEQEVVVKPDNPIGDPKSQQALLDEYLEHVDDT